MSARRAIFHLKACLRFPAEEGMFFIFSAFVTASCLQICRKGYCKTPAAVCGGGKVHDFQLKTRTRMILGSFLISSIVFPEGALSISMIIYALSPFDLSLHIGDIDAAFPEMIEVIFEITPSTLSCITAMRATEVRGARYVGEVDAVRDVSVFDVVNEFFRRHRRAVVLRLGRAGAEVRHADGVGNADQFFAGEVGDVASQLSRSRQPRATTVRCIRRARRANC